MHEEGGFDYRWVYGLDRLSVKVTSEGTNWWGQNVKQDILKDYAHQDRMGSTTNLTDQFGRVVGRADYNEWGELTYKEELNITSAYRRIYPQASYTGHDWDDVLGMYYAKARFYDPAAKRFVAMDPIKGNVADPLSLVPYIYCVDNPLKWVDPLGQEHIVISGNHTGTYATRNFIEPAIRTIREWFSEKDQLNECITWIVVDDGYSQADKNNIARFISYNIYCAYPKQFRHYEDAWEDGGSKEGQTQLHNEEHYLRIIYVSSNSEIFDYFNSGYNQSRKNEKITQTVIFSHGLRGILATGYNSKEAANIGYSELENFDREAFAENYFCVLYSCNPGTETKDGTSFAQEWANATGGYTLGIKNTQSTYRYINEDRNLLWKINDGLGRRFEQNFDYNIGSSQYPRISEEDDDKSWQLYRPNLAPINASSIMKDYKTLPTLQDIQSLIS